MKDAEVRGLVLSKLYNLRHEMDIVPVPQGFELPGLDMTASQNLKMVGNILKQLDDLHLIKFTQFMGEQFRSGYAAITAFGVDVVEGAATSPITITIDSSVNVHGSQGVQIGGQGNSLTVSIDVDSLINAVDSGSATIQEKEQAKSLLKKVTDNPLVKAAFDLWIKAHGAG